MDVHNNARLTPQGRGAMVRAVVDKGLSKAAAGRRGPLEARGGSSSRARHVSAAGNHSKSVASINSPGNHPW